MANIPHLEFSFVKKILKNLWTQKEEVNRKSVSVLTPESIVFVFFGSKCSKKIKSDKEIKISKTAPLKRSVDKKIASNFLTSTKIKKQTF